MNFFLLFLFFLPEKHKEKNPCCEKENEGVKRRHT